jgi:hypothetical protein
MPEATDLTKFLGIYISLKLLWMMEVQWVEGNSNAYTQKQTHITLGKSATEFAKVHLLA